MSKEQSREFVSVPASVHPPGDARPLAGVVSNDTNQEGQEGALPLLDILRRRWRVMLLVWLTVAGPGIAYVWLRFGTEYEASGMIRVAPIIPRILFRDEESGMLPMYGVFVQTQITMLQSRTVLDRALNDPDVRALPWVVQTLDPVAVVASRLEIENPHNTELIVVSMRGREPEELATVVNAVLNAYIQYAQDRDLAGSAGTMATLDDKQQELQLDLQGAQEALYNEAAAFGTTSLDSRQDAAFVMIQEIQTDLIKARSALITAASQVEALKSQTVIDQAPDVLEQRKQQHLTEDAELRTLQEAKLSNEWDLTVLSGRFGPKHAKLHDLRARVADLDRRITERQDSIAQSVETNAKRQAQASYEADLRDAERRLAEATETEQLLDGLVTQELAKLADTGKQSLRLQALRDTVEQTKQLHDAVIQRIQHIDVEKQRPARVTLASAASIPTAPSKDSRRKYSAMAVLGAFFLAGMVGIFVDRMDTAIHSERDVALHMGVPVLGTRAQLESKPVTNKQTETRVSEELRTLRAALLFGDTPVDGHSLLVTSPNAREGKTTLVLDLGRALARSGRRVLLIDADNTKRDLSRRMGFADEPGLADALGNGHIAADLLRATTTDRLTLLTAGPHRSDFSELLAHPGRLDQFCQLFKQYDNVLIDSPPVLLSSEPMVWARHVDVSLAVVRADQCPREDAKVARQRLTQAGSHVIGAVLTGINPRDRYYRRRYAYTYERKAESSSSET